MSPASSPCASSRSCGQPTCRPPERTWSTRQSLGQTLSARRRLVNSRTETVLVALTLGGEDVS